MDERTGDNSDGYQDPPGNIQITFTRGGYRLPIVPEIDNDNGCREEDNTVAGTKQQFQRNSNEVKWHNFGGG